MRRPPIACQRAVQSIQSPAPQHIWVPDEVLSLAVHRFFHSTCPQQKRHGSSVPGPLEARRRATKRRMTASAGYYPQNTFPTSFSLGALFGYRSNPQTSWRYEPPSLPQMASGSDTLSSTLDHMPSGDIQPPPSANDTSSNDYDLPRSHTQQSANSSERCGSLHTVAPTSPNLSATERALTSHNELEQSLENFKAGFVAAQIGRSSPRVEGLLKGLFKQNLPSSPFVWQYCTAVLHYLDLAGGTPVPVLRILLEEEGRLLRTLDPLQSPSDCAAFLDSLDAAWDTEHRRRKPFVHRVFRVMADSAAEARRSTTELQDDVLLRLIDRMSNRVPHPELRILHRLASNLSENAENSLLLSHFNDGKRLQDIITATVRNVAAAPDGIAIAERALSYVPRSRLLDAVPTVTLRLAKRAKDNNMSTWLRLLHRLDVKDDDGKKLLDHALQSLAETLDVHGKRSPCPVSPKHFVEAVLLRQGLDLEIRYATETGPRVQNVLVDVLLQLQAQPKAYIAFLELALPLVARHAGSATVLRCLRSMEGKGLSLPTHTELESIIVRELAELQLSTTATSKIQARDGALTLQACKRLTKALSRVDCALPKMKMTQDIRQFDNVLIHARANHALPINCRDATADLPLAERIILVHQLAHHYAQDTTLTHRAAWRCIYYLYKYLESNSLPLGPLFTQSVTHLSITRPLMENRFVSVRRLIWVCHLVARVEGDAVAARLENVFYKSRGDTVGRAKQAYVGVGGSKQRKAHIGSMKRLGLI